MMCFNPDLLPDAADPVGSVRYDNVNIVRLLIPCKEEGTLTQFYKDDSLFIIYDCSPEYDNQAVESFKGTVLEEADEYNWWRNIIDKENENE